jgi:hypothetical protein
MDKAVLMLDMISTQFCAELTLPLRTSFKGIEWAVYWTRVEPDIDVVCVVCTLI